MIDHLSEDEAAAVAALLNRPVAWTSAGELARDLGWGEARTAELLWGLNLAGWFDFQAFPLEKVGQGGEVSYVHFKTYCLSPFGACLLGLVVEEVRENEWRWVAKPLRDDPPKSVPDRDFEGDPIQDLPDPRPAVDQVEQAEERAISLAKRKRQGRSVLVEDHYYPVVFYGMSLMVWTERGQGERVARGERSKGKRSWKGPCPGCRGRHLETHEYCLVCDAWGRDSSFRSGEDRQAS